MAENSSFVLAAGMQAAKRRRLLSLSRNDVILLSEVGVGYALILGTIWTARPLQRWLFWISAAWFLSVSATALWRRRPLRLKPLAAGMAALTIVAAMLAAGGLVALAGALGTLHELFGGKSPLIHACSYLVWAIVQQYIQQAFFFTRLEEVTQNGSLACFMAACMFGLAHLPNPVLTPVTFLGGWVLSELFRRHRSVVPLGISHGLVGIALALSVPDHIQHHMRVGLSYLRYIS
jgi:Type II CAAX prenyl endopeptidase Rce1-like